MYELLLLYMVGRDYKRENNDSGLLDSVEEVARMEKQKHRFHVKNSCEMERKIGFQQKCSKNSIWTNWAMGYQVLSTSFLAKLLVSWFCLDDGNAYYIYIIKNKFYL